MVMAECVACQDVNAVSLPAADDHWEPARTSEFLQLEALAQFSAAAMIFSISAPRSTTLGFGRINHGHEVNERWHY